MRRRPLLIGLGSVCVALWVAVAAVALLRDGGGDGRDGEEDLVAELLSDDELALIHQAVPDPACASEPTAQPEDESLVAVTVVRVDGTCLDAVTEYIPEDQVDSRLAELDEDPGVVAAAEAPPPPSLDQADDRRERQWALDMLGGTEGSSALPWPDGTGVVVAVLDSGVDAAHPDLGDAVLARRSYPGETDLDPDGHGTAVSGIVAARSGNGGGVGVTPGVSVLDVPVTLRQARQNPDSWQVALPWAVNHGAHVANMSFGQSVDEVAEDKLRVAVAVVEFANHNDVVVAASGGNCGRSCSDDRQVPAMLPGVLTVGAVQKDRDIAGYSARNRDIDLVAPGGGEAMDRIETLVPGGGYTGDFNGTSASAPHVAAAAAAARAAVPEATADDIIRALIDTADPEGVSEQDRDDVGAGHGFVDILGATEELRSTPSRPSGDPADSTRAAYVHDGTLYVYDGDTSHPVREVGDDHGVQSVVWSTDHTRLVGADDTTLFSWGGVGSELVEVACDECAYNELAYLDDVTDGRTGDRTGDLVVTLADDGTLTRWSPATLEPQGTVALAIPRAGGESLAVLQGAVDGSLLVYASGGVDDQKVLWLVDPFSGEGQVSHEVDGRWGGLAVVDAAGERVAYVNRGPEVGGTCADVQEAIVLDRQGMTPIANPDLPSGVVFDEIFFNGGTLYAVAENIERNSDGACPTTGSAGLWRVAGDSWEQVDATAIAAARPLEGMTGDESTGWLVVTEDEQGYVAPRTTDGSGGTELGAVDLGRYPGGLWATPTHDEVPRAQGASSGGGELGGTGEAEDAAPGGVAAAVARFETFLHALGEGDLDTVCEIAGPAYATVEDELGECQYTFDIVLDMIPADQEAALRTATVDPDRVEVRAPDEVHIPVEAVVASASFSENDLGSNTLRYQDGNWFIVD